MGGGWLAKGVEEGWEEEEEEEEEEEGKGVRLLLGGDTRGEEEGGGTNERTRYQDQELKIKEPSTSTKPTEKRKEKDWR